MKNDKTSYDLILRSETFFSFLYCYDAEVYLEKYLILKNIIYIVYAHIYLLSYLNREII